MNSSSILFIGLYAVAVAGRLWRSEREKEMRREEKRIGEKTRESEGEVERDKAAERRVQREVKRKRKTPTPNAKKRRNVVLGLMASVNINAQRIYTKPRHSCSFTRSLAYSSIEAHSIGIVSK